MKTDNPVRETGGCEILFAFAAIMIILAFILSGCEKPQLTELHIYNQTMDEYNVKIIEQYYAVQVDTFWNAIMPPGDHQIIPLRQGQYRIWKKRNQDRLPLIAPMFVFHGMNNSFAIKDYSE